ncbi:hypothetical protein [Glaciecola sp. 1036]|uniref:hypothetical protein n=1 Tax=Alteromonadaceae TaxID=72275 RepID=UPI003CFD0FF3
MSIHQVSELVLKVAAILCFVYAISHVGYYSSYFFIESMPPIDIIISSGIGPIIGPIFVGIILFLSAKSLGKKLISLEDKADRAVEISIAEWKAMLLSLMGIFIVVSTIVPLVNQIFAIVNIDKGPAFEGLPSSYIAWLTGYIITLIMGLWFTVGSRGIVGAIRKLRFAGR